MPRTSARVLALALAVALACTSAVSAGSDTGDRQDLEIVVKPREPRPDVFVLRGRVRPDYRKQEAILQRRNCGDCRWFAFERFETDGESRFKLRVPTPGPDVRAKTCYRVKVARSDKYRRAISMTNCISGVQPG